ncbi:phosphatase PAP2 family protein [Aquibacillus salsiterrae]|uniref:Phosphatase PAP2 family protein n=1 Tax=Aquibacillus salsiterrae TaxID=2950439 RepID=A0A9X4AGM1_9BACI|nr:phosphatase PAP2 family protein [Aquibacillus salsiterrae]MDC3417430.1 phosphatase PAP2 family protein [Aquibacillus salsiterrae]
MEEKQIKKSIIPLVLVLAGLGVISFSTYIFIKIGQELLSKEINAFDSTIINFLKTIETDTLDLILLFVTELGSVWFLTTMSVVVIVLLWIRGKDGLGIAMFILAVAGGAIITKILKEHYNRGRPSINPEIDAVGFSFPSGHSMGSLIFYGFMIYFIIRSRRSIVIKSFLSAFFGFLIIAIGFSRIYLGAHYPSDVLAGYLAGAVWVILCILGLEWLEWQTRYHIRPFRSIRKFFANRN